MMYKVNLLCIIHKVQKSWLGSGNALGNVEYLFITITPRSTQARSGSI